MQTISRPAHAAAQPGFSGRCRDSGHGGRPSRLRGLCASVVLAAAGLTAAQAAAPDKVVLIAGDDSLPVFDNAVQGVQADLAAAGAGARDVVRLSAAATGADSATLGHVLAAVAGMHPTPGQGCLVFATSHGGKHAGLFLADGETFLTPRALDAALTQGCGAAPTAVVISACYSGSFTEAPMARPNRVVLAAARPDRSSFGCGAGRVLTVYDACLLKAWRPGAAWQSVFAVVKGCVRTEELIEQVRASEPQAWFGPRVAGLRLPGG